MKKGIVFLMFFVGLFSAVAQSTGKYQIKFLEINKENSDYGVTILDENKLIFTSALEEARNNRKNYNPRKDLYIGDINYDGEIINVKPVLNASDADYNQTGVTYTSDRKTVYFSRNKYSKRKSKQKKEKNKRLELFKADVDANGNWTNIKKLPINKSGSSSGFPVLSQDDSKMFFVSDRKSSLGGTDIYVVNIDDKGNFGKPKNLGSHVNTKGNETTPFITTDNILYFSSDGHKGMGRLDVFAVEVYEDSTTEAYHLASPINSINDDFAYIVNKDNNQGFFTSNRLQGDGFNDLYAFTLEEDVRPGECFISVDGKVQDSESKEIIAGATVNLYDISGNLIETVSTYNDGTYSFTVSCANEYKLMASHDGYKKDIKHIEILEENYHSALHTNLDLDKLVKDTPKVEFERLSPIYYEFDSAVITETAAIEMDKIVKIMKEHPTLTIEAASFTDARGSNSYNLGLSKRRAQAAVDYMISQGIEPGRIISKGFGEEKLVNHCVNGIDCDEHAHQLNRRTEFNFVNKKTSYHKPKAKLEKPTKAVTKKSYQKPAPVVAQAEPRVTAAEPKKEAAPIKELSTKPEAQVKKSNSTQAVAEVKTEQVAKPKVVASKTVEPKVKQEAKPEAPVATVTPKTTSEKRSQAKQRRTSGNRAVDYITEQKDKVIAKLDELKNKYSTAEVEQIVYKDSIAIEIHKIIALKDDIKSNQEAGWSNIIEYKSNLKSFNKRYQHIMNVANNRPTFNAVKKSTANNNHEPPAEEKTSNEVSQIEDISESLSIDDVEVVAMKKSKSGKYSVTSSARKTDMIKVSFKMLQNEKVEAGKKKAHVILEKPKGDVAQAKGVFTLKGNQVQKKYTDQTVVKYDQNDVNVTMFIERRGDNLEQGVYPVKLFLDGELVGVTNLDLQSPF